MIDAVKSDSRPVKTCRNLHKFQACTKLAWWRFLTYSSAFETLYIGNFAVTFTHSFTWYTCSTWSFSVQIQILVIVVW